MSYQYQHQGSRYHIPFESGNLSERNNNGYARRRVEQAGGGDADEGTGKTHYSPNAPLLLCIIDRMLK